MDWDWRSSDIANVLVFLLPGFLSAAILDSLASRPVRPRSEFDRVVLALILTMVCQLVVAVVHRALVLLGSVVGTISDWAPVSELTASLLVAACLGMALVWAADTDSVHAAFRRMGLTRQDSYPSEWASTFFRNQGYVVLHLSDDRRLFGWPRVFPLDPAAGHFRIHEPSWLLADGSQTVPAGVDSILIRGSDVVMVEFMPGVRP